MNESQICHNSCNIKQIQVAFLSMFVCSIEYKVFLFYIYILHIFFSRNMKGPKRTYMHRHISVHSMLCFVIEKSDTCSMKYSFQSKIFALIYFTLQRGKIWNKICSCLYSLAHVPTSMAEIRFSTHFLSMYVWAISLFFSF